MDLSSSALEQLMGQEIDTLLILDVLCLVLKCMDRSQTRLYIYIYIYIDIDTHTHTPTFKKMYYISIFENRTKPTN